MSQIEKNNEEERILPLMTLREVVIFPQEIRPLFIGREHSVKATEEAFQNKKMIILVTQRDQEVEKPTKGDLFEIGMLCRILQLLRLPDGTLKVLFEGVDRVEFELVENKENIFDTAKYTVFPEIEGDKSKGEALLQMVQEALQEFASFNKLMTAEVMQSISKIKESGALANRLLPYLKASYVELQQILELSDTVARLEKVYELLIKEIELTALDRRIKGRVKEQMEKNHREYYLNEQIKAINKEMGREDDIATEVIDLELTLDSLDMDETIRERVRRDLRKLRTMSQSAAEFIVIRNYIDCVLELPWGNYKETAVNINTARSILDEDHFGLEKAKKRILEYLAVQSLVKTMKGPILCLVGPPGVGKTSIAKSIARAMDRDFVRLSLGGVRDEAEIRGHRRTYIGALPGKFIQALRRCKTGNPVICLDEIDKMSSDFRGDPAAALLEVLDPQQNNTFADHYLDLDYDLSKIFFITTANSLEEIPLALRDRMEIIKLTGYLEPEKKTIAKSFLVPRQLEEHGLVADNLVLPDAILTKVIQEYTKEAGVRSLEREIGALCRKIAIQVVEKEDRELQITIDEILLEEFLGVEKYTYGERESENLIGIVNGLAWTSLGGELLTVETALMPGTGKIEITGKLGEVMQESAKAAISYIRSRSDSLGLRTDFYKDVDIHVHVPEGATPKDGPSAGVTLVTSLISAFLNLPVRNDVAMTGEITLRGRILPIGGVREKLLAAVRGKVKTVFIPSENAKDLKEVPKDILAKLEIIPVKYMDEILSKALDMSNEDLVIKKLDNIPHGLDLRMESIFPSQ